MLVSMKHHLSTNVNRTPPPKSRHHPRAGGARAGAPLGLAATRAAPRPARVASTKPTAASRSTASTACPRRHVPRPRAAAAPRARLSDSDSDLGLYSNVDEP